MHNNREDYLKTTSKLIEEIIKNHQDVVKSKPSNRLAAKIKVSSIIKMRNEIMMASKGFESY